MLKNICVGFIVCTIIIINQSNKYINFVELNKMRSSIKSEVTNEQQKQHLRSASSNNKKVLLQEKQSNTLSYLYKN